MEEACAGIPLPKKSVPRPLPCQASVQGGEAQGGGFEIASKEDLVTRELPMFLCKVKFTDNNTGDRQLHSDAAHPACVPALERARQVAKLVIEGAADIGVVQTRYTRVYQTHI
jgi:hypothetical protein